MKISSYLLFGTTALLPALAVGIGFKAEYNTWIIYALLKGFMLVSPFFVLSFKEEFRPTTKDFRVGLISAGILCLIPLIFIALGGLEVLDPTPIREKLSRLGILPWFLPMVGLLSTVNAFLEEWYFRGWLIKICPKIPAGKAALLNGSLFSLHHFIILNDYFPLPWALFFAFGTGVAGWVWTLMRLRGVSIFTLFVSHCICDLILLGLGGSLLIF